MPAPIPVDLWFVQLGGDERQRRAAQELLDPTEQARAARFRFDRDRDQYVFSHATLRQILGQRWGVNPNAIRYETGPAGKPACARPLGSDLSFNLSHAGDCALIGVTAGLQIGVDVEAMARTVDEREIVTRFFSTAERAAWDDFAASEKSTAFFRAWTLKEAYVKARGDGLGHDSQRYTVELRPDQPARLVADEIDPTAPARFKLFSVAAPIGYAAAVAVEVPVPTLIEIRIRHWPGSEV
ncbi:MAG: 4'-phosphopantetheinyl transferase family protein [bacterium]